MSLYTAVLLKHNPVLEIGHLSLVHLRSGESVGFVGNAYQDVFFSKNVSDPVNE